MRTDWGKSFILGQIWAQFGVALLLALTAVVIAAATFLAAAGILPWIELPLYFGGQPVANGGMFVQIGVTILVVGLCAFLPSTLRVMRLEAAHREFGLRMDDVARAYWVAHAADREGLFNLSREYDAVRERLLFLRSHPDLGNLDAEVLEIAAQMSHQSRELAEIYSDDNVARARETLNRRRIEADELSDRITEASRATAEIRRLAEEVGMEEDILRTRISRLREEMADLIQLVDPPAAPQDKPSARRAKIGVVPGE